jgi:cytosine/adenosine deaminase-related metal-dependent hydrolase
MAPDAVFEAGSLDLDANGNIRCVGCDCEDREEEDDGKLVLSCPDWVIAPGFINLHDHLGYAGTPPLAHPGELYEHRNDWRLGEHGHAALKFSGGASAAQVLAQELRHVMAGTTSVVGSGGRRGLLRNLEQPNLTESLLPGRIDAETFPLDDAAARVDSAACQFGPTPDTPLLAAGYAAYVAHVGEGTSQRARDELRCALGPLGLLGETSAVVHAMALTREGAKRLAQRGASVVWSPRSNIDLYGSTAPVALLTSLGVNVALGTDWLASGSMNLLRELACARRYSDEVLGGYFDDAELLGMVTEHAAWALGLERRLGELRAGLVGDIAVFAEHGDAFASVVGASASDVQLVLRGGVPLYGDSDLVRAFRDGEACEELEVCGITRRACVLETGLGLGEIQAAGEAVYPLFSCEPPADEPSCQAQVSRECPAGEAECVSPGAGPSYASRDADEDGTADLDDVCPRVFDHQTDSDGDGQGDACDACPLENSGLRACSLSIAQLRAPATRLSRGAAVRLSDGRVTALRLQGSKGYYLEDGDHADYSGIFVYTGSTAPTVRLGELVDVQGYFEPFDATDELVDVQLLAQRATPELYVPRVVVLADAADGSPRAAALQSLWLRIDGAEVASQNPDAPQDYDETGLVGGLRLDDLLLPELDNGYAPGTRFSAIQGILGTSFGHQKLFPLNTADLVVE